MGEKEYRQQYFSIDLGKETIICTPDNTRAYLYENPEYDHLFYIKSEDDEGYYGYPLYRKHLGLQFDKVVKKMIKNGYEVTNEEAMTDLDWHNYYNAHPEKIPEPKTHELTPGEEKHYRFLEYLVEHNLLTDEDFRDGNGELFI